MRFPLSLSRRASAAALALTSLSMLAWSADAAAGEYTVIQCGRDSRDYADAQFDRRNGGDYTFGHYCDAAAEANSLQIRSITGTPVGHRGRIWWQAPDGTALVGIRVDARLRSDAGHSARLDFLDAGGNDDGRIATGADEPGGFARFERRLTGSGRGGFAATLACTTQPSCPQSDQARVALRELQLTLDDGVAPTLTAGGPLLSGDWQRGEAGLEAALTDLGSGVRRVEVAVGGLNVAPTQTFDCETVAGSAVATRLQPCASARRVERVFDTSAPPFGDGENQVRICAHDYGPGGNQSCANEVVRVDNTPPLAAFANERAAEDPELIRAQVSDAHSGVASGSISYRPAGPGPWRVLPTALNDGVLSARVDSSSEPKGRYLFRVEATDIAGNVASSTQRADGEQMALQFPLRERTRLAAALQSGLPAAYGSRPRLAGVLRDGSGRPIPGEDVEIRQRYAAGSTMPPLVRYATTDNHGRFTLRLQAGPSRRVFVGYEGSRRYLPAPEVSLGVGVRGRASLRSSARRVLAGAKVLFSGSVGRRGAALPAAGKLVELQVRERGDERFRTVRQAFRTDQRGRWRLRYGFGRFYTRAVRFQFRLKVTPESRWPYAAPARSKVAELVVAPR